MRSMRRLVSVTLPLLLCAMQLGAAVKTEQKSQVKFEGMMGRMMGFFGGKTMKEGVINTVSVKGNRKASLSDYGGEIIDLDEEKVYTIDTRKKTYEVTTFAEMKRRMEEAREKAAKEARQATGKKEAEQPQQAQEPNMEIDFSLKESGQKKNINGFDCREVVMTVTAREKGKTLDQGGGMVLTSNMWLAPRIEAMKESEEFDRRYAQKMGEIVGIPSAEQGAAALAMYPALKDMMGKMQTEKVNMDGTPILTVMTMDAVKSPEQMSQQQRESEPSDNSPTAAIGGLIGRRLMRKKDNPPPQAPNRATIMTMNSELLKVTPDVTAADLSVPAGYREIK
jgi:hypothetical protein